MAEDTTESAPAMDYAEHERTYAGFMEFTKLTIVAVINILIVLILTTMTGAVWSGFFLLFLTLAAAAIGIMTGGSHKASTGVMILGVLLFLLSIM